MHKERTSEVFEKGEPAIYKNICFMTRIILMKPSASSTITAFVTAHCLLLCTFPPAVWMLFQHLLPVLIALTTYLPLSLERGATVAGSLPRWIQFRPTSAVSVPRGGFLARFFPFVYLRGHLTLSKPTVSPRGYTSSALVDDS